MKAAACVGGGCRAAGRPLQLEQGHPDWMLSPGPPPSVDGRAPGLSGAPGRNPFEHRGTPSSTGEPLRAQGNPIEHRGTIGILTQLELVVKEGGRRSQAKVCHVGEGAARAPGGGDCAGQLVEAEVQALEAAEAAAPFGRQLAVQLVVLQQQLLQSPQAAAPPRRQPACAQRGGQSDECALPHCVDHGICSASLEPPRRSDLQAACLRHLNRHARAAEHTSVPCAIAVLSSRLGFSHWADPPHHAMLAWACSARGAQELPPAAQLLPQHRSHGSPGRGAGASAAAGAHPT